MRRLPALFAAAALLLAGPALAGPKDAKTTAKAWEEQCVDDVMSEGLSEGQGKKICKCSRKEVAAWIDEADGHERSLRLWTVHYQSDPAGSDDDFYREAAAAGVGRDELTDLIITMYFDSTQFFRPCEHLISR